MTADYRFPGGFQLTARNGGASRRFFAATIAECLAWAAGMRDQGWQVTEPTPWTPRLPGDMGRLNSEGSDAA